MRSLENPPLLIVSDMERIELHTNWTNTVQEVHTLSLPELADARRRQLLKRAFSEIEVEQLKPGKTREALTKEVALRAANKNWSNIDPDQSPGLGGAPIDDMVLQRLRFLVRASATTAREN